MPETPDALKAKMAMLGRQLTETLEQQRATEAEMKRRDAETQASLGELMRYCTDRHNEALDTGEASPAHSSYVIENAKDPVDAYLRTTYSLLSDPLYGVQQTPEGFVWSGKTYGSLDDLKGALTQWLGVQPQVNSRSFAALVRGVISPASNNKDTAREYAINTATRKHQETSEGIQPPGLTTDHMFLAQSKGIYRVF